MSPPNAQQRPVSDSTGLDVDYRLGARSVQQRGSVGVSGEMRMGMAEHGFHDRGKPLNSRKGVSRRYSHARIDAQSVSEKAMCHARHLEVAPGVNVADCRVRVPVPVGSVALQRQTERNG